MSFLNDRRQGISSWRRIGFSDASASGSKKGVEKMTSSRLRMLVHLAVLSAVVAAFSAVGAGPAFAAHVTCGQVITQNTHVGNDLTNCPGDGLVIGANNIKLDLGGHTIDGVNNPTSDGINNKGGFDNVIVRHGTIQQFHIGVELTNADGNKLTRLEVTQNPFDGIRLTGSNNNRIGHVRESSSFDGIFLTNSDHNRISHSRANGNGSSGIVLQFLNDFNKVDHNVARDNGAWGLTSDGSHNDTYTHNKVYKNGTAGLEPFNGVSLGISKNTVLKNGIGIVFFNTDTSVLKRNRLRSNTSDGIQTDAASTGNQLIKNQSNKNGHDGIHVSGTANTITKNHADKNANLGIFALVGNIDGGGNRAHHNGNAAQCAGVVCH
jgi:parallel beta-helix repeat protein